MCGEPRRPPEPPRRRSRPRGPLVILAAVVAATRWAGPRAAAEDVPANAAGTPARAAVAVVGVDEPEGLWLRLRGHLADLAVEVEPVDAAGAPTLQTAPVRATWLVGRVEARFVVWIERRDARAFTVLVVDRSVGRFVERSIALEADPASVLDASALLESTAVAVRGTLRSLLLGEPPADVPFEPLPDPDALTPPAPPLDGPPPDAPPAGPSRPARIAPTDTWWMSVGSRSRIDGLHAVGQHGPAVAFGRTLGRAHVAAALALGLPLAIEDARGALSLLRIDVEVALGHSLAAGQGWRAGGEAAAGVAVVRRGMAESSTGQDATPGARVHVLPTGRAALTLDISLGDGLSVGAAAGATLHAVDLELGYLDGGRFIHRLSPWRATPVLDLRLLALL